MFETALAQLRFAAALVRGRLASPAAVDRLVEGALATYREFGSFTPETGEVLTGPELDGAGRAGLQRRLFRQQARAAAGTAYYARLFADLGVDPGHLDPDVRCRLPLTVDAALTAEPGAFVHRDRPPVLWCTTSGTTGRPTAVAFGGRELAVMVGRAALGGLTTGSIVPDDVVQLSTTSRGGIANAVVSRSAERIGALVHLAGNLPAAATLQLLTERRPVPGHHDRPSVLVINPSALGALVEMAARQGAGPTDFGLRGVCLGGELVSQGLRDRAREVLGDVELEEAYGMTETYPFGGVSCSRRHVHHDPNQGMVELLDPEGAVTDPPGPATGSVARLVVTPFGTVRETTLVLRYDTGDLVETLPAGPLTCEMSGHPATGRFLGKRSLTVPTDDGDVHPRQLVEALEALRCVPLPARFEVAADGGGAGVALRVLARDTGAGTRQAVGDALEAHAVPVRRLELVADRTDLRSAYPLRCDGAA